MITNEILNDIVGEAKSSGYDVKVRDICYSLLCRYFDDAETVYRCLFDPHGVESMATMTAYQKSTKVAYLESQLKDYIYKPTGGKKKNAGEAITFDENLAYMLRLKKETEEKLAAGEIEFKDAVNVLKDITVKINDKFKVGEEVKDQIVVVNQKYDAICPHCHHEVASRPMSKIEAMEMYNLIEKVD